MRPILALLCVMALPGCFHYVPVETVPARGTAVRVLLERPLPVELADLTAHNVTEVRGEVVREEPDRLLLSAFWLVAAGTAEYRGDGETVWLPTDALAAVQEKRISLLRSAGAGVALGAVIYAIAAGLDAAVGGGDSGDGGGPAK